VIRIGLAHVGLASSEGCCMSMAKPTFLVTFKHALSWQASYLAVPSL
jgi:hypothetical protein